MAEHTKNWLGFVIITMIAAVVAGLLAGLLCRWWGWSFTIPAITVGLAVGSAGAAFGWPELNERLVVVIFCLAAGLGLFFWTGHQPSWQAQTSVEDGEIDRLCIRIKALRICHERRIMGVFDYNDVPHAIREEARRYVENMSRQEKLAMLDRTFGRRINAADSSSSVHAGSMLPGGGLWIVLAAAAASIPGFIRHRYMDSGAPACL